ncbi:acetolactate decarboxylase [Methanohalophilus mahii]|nr:acetolactate decarboxylase [Methanohalophilus mahii]
MSNNVWRIVLLSILLFLAFSGCTATTDETYVSNNDVLFQTSTIDSLIAGSYDGDMQVCDLKEQGGFGLGTFDRLDGEMIVMDGEIYQAKADGHIYQVNDTITTPFAAVTFFEADDTITIGSNTDYASLQSIIKETIPGPNLMYALKIEGTFENISIRSVPAQSKPYRPLLEVVAEEETVYYHENINGTMVGFLLPYYIENINVPGYHFHFIDANKTVGGHVLACNLTSGLVELDYTYDFTLSLPESSSFSETLPGNKDTLEAIEQ